MVRPPLSPQERLRGERLGMLLRQARGQRSMTEVATASGVPVETLRKIETGRIVTPAFFTVASLASALEVPLQHIASQCVAAPGTPGLGPPVVGLRRSGQGADLAS